MKIHRIIPRWDIPFFCANVWPSYRCFPSQDLYVRDVWGGKHKGSKDWGRCLYMKVHAFWTTWGYHARNSFLRICAGLCTYVCMFKISARKDVQNNLPSQISFTPFLSAYSLSRMCPHIASNHRSASKPKSLIRCPAFSWLSFHKSSYIPSSNMMQLKRNPFLNFSGNVCYYDIHDIYAQI